MTISTPLKILLALGLCPVWWTDAAAKDADLRDDHQKSSYALAIGLMDNLRDSGVPIDARAFELGIRDGLAHRESRLSKAELQAAMARTQAELEKRHNTQAEQNLAISKAFLAQNKQRKEIIELPSGLQYEIVQPGTGAKASPTDTVTVNYRGTTLAGVEFDSSERRKHPAKLAIPNTIQGWREILPLMPTGSKWRIFVPPELGYGSSGSPSGKIGPNETLIFEMELLAFETGTGANPFAKPKAPTAPQMR